jgi:hypothetical protein
MSNRLEIAQKLTQYILLALLIYNSFDFNRKFKGNI